MIISGIKIDSNWQIMTVEVISSGKVSQNLGRNHFGFNLWWESCTVLDTCTFKSKVRLTFDANLNPSIALPVCHRCPNEYFLQASLSFNYRICPIWWWIFTFLLNSKRNLLKPTLHLLQLDGMIWHFQIKLWILKILKNLIIKKTLKDNYILCNMNIIFQINKINSTIFFIVRPFTKRKCRI